MKTPKIIRRLALLFAICCCVAPAARAQTGLPPFGTFQRGGFDTTNLINLNTYFNIPIMSSPGRGIGVSYGMTYNSAFWAVDGNVWTPPVDSSGNPIFGWTLSGSMGNMLGGVTYDFETLTACGYNQRFEDFYYRDTNGTSHPFSLTVYSSSTCGSTSASGYAQDNSGFFLSVTAASGSVNSTVTYPSGNGQSGTQLMDANGNYVSKSVSGTETDFTDTVGRTALKVNAGSGSTTVKWLDPTGAYQTTTVVYSSFNVKTNFGCGSVEYSGTANLPTEIDLPNGNKYQFTYETTPGYSGYTTGRIQKVTLPAGGYYQYDYTGPTDGTYCGGGANISLTRTINDGTNSTQWTYDRSGGVATIVTAPPMPYSSVSNQSSYTSTQQKFYQGSVSGGTFLKTVDTTWATNGTPATQITTLNDISQKSEVVTTYDSNGNLTQAKEYDWGSGAVGSLLRETDFTYRSSIPFLQTQKLVKDGSGNIKFREDYTYDGGTLTSQTGITQHDDTHFGSSYTTRGNLTSITNYTDPVTPGGVLTKNFAYNTLGNLLTTLLGTVQQRQYVYSPTTIYAAPDSVTSGPTSGPQLTTSYTYNSYTGLVASTTDPNGQTISYGYDVYKRPTTTTLPDSTQLSTSYNDSTFTVTSTTPIDSTPHKKVSVVAYDGLGRPVTATLEDYSSTVYSITQTQYDPLGRVFKTSNPYTGSPSYWTTSEYDALGRSIATILPDGSQSVASYLGNVVTSTDPAGKQRKSTFDAPGRLIEVDEPSATATLAAGSGSGTVSGTEQYHAAAGATAGHGQVSIGGSEQSADEGDYEWVCTLWSCDGACEHQELDWVSNWVYDTGTVSITVNGHTDSATYNTASTTGSVASALASAINGDSSASVTASASSGVIALTAKTTGASTDYALSSSSATTGDPYAFFSPSFYGSPSGNILTGGGPATSSSYDTGAVSITVDGNIISVSYGTSSTASSIASALISAVNSATSLPVTASGSGAGITLTATTSGAATNYSISSASSTSQPTLFSSPSFSVPSFGPALTGGVGPDAWSSSVSTTYTYDVLNDLTGVTQGSQTRGYTYDGLGRNTSASIPETTSGGTQQTSYFNFDVDSSCSTPNSFLGQLVSTVDARTVRTCMQYDTLNRITGINYNVGSTGVSATPSVTNTYGTSSSSHNNGRLASMSDGTGSESYTYDIFGRITELDKVVGTTTYSTEYAYNLASEMTQITYPSGRVVKQTYDAVGRLCGVGASGSTCSSGTSYASGYSYNNAGEVYGFNYGNGVVANLSYTPDRLQLQCLQYDTTSLSSPCTKDSSALFMLTYAYGSSGANNGQISSITDGMDNGRTASYTYDGLGRLSTAGTVGSTGYAAWGLSWTYDRYGNRTAQTVTAGSAPSDSLSVSATTNHITNTGFSYDAAGNMTNDGYNALTYDAASRLITASNGSSSGAYAYDGKGMRVKKCVPNCSSPTTTTVYILSGSKVIAEYDNGASVGSPSRENIYSGSTQIAKVAGGTTTYYQQDHLSNRLITNSSGGVVEQMGHLPYGESWYDTGGEKWVFTAYERDGESGNDYAQARYDISRLGRFSSPDPLSGSTANPQSLNHYAYTGNDPVNLVDPTGLEACDPSVLGPGQQLPPVCTEAIMDTGQAPNALGFGGCVECEFDSGFLEEHQEYLAYQDLQNFVNDLATNLSDQGKIVFVNGNLFFSQTNEESERWAIAKQLADKTGIDLAEAYNDLISEFQPPHGGNYNFFVTGTLLDTLNGLDKPLCGNSGRCGNFDSLDFSHNTEAGHLFDTVHMDTANPTSMFGLGAVVHFFVDIVLGWTAYAVGGIPR